MAVEMCHKLEKKKQIREEKVSWYRVFTASRFRGWSLFRSYLHNMSSVYIALRTDTSPCVFLQPET